MTEQSRIYATPLCIYPNQIKAVATALNSGHIAAVHKKLSTQPLVEDPDLFQSHAGKSVRLWGNAALGKDFLAVAEFPNGQMTVATKGAVLLAFKDCRDCSGGGVNAALMTTNKQKFQFFGSAREKIPNDPAFIELESDLGHHAIHMIGKPHNCSGLPDGPAGMK